MTPLVVALIAGLLPGFAWLAFYLMEDTHAEPKRMILFTFVVGMAFAFFTVAIENIFNSWVANVGVQELSILSLIGLAAIEEIMKFSAAHFAVNRTPTMIEPIDAMIYMIIAALGFATLENIGAIANIVPGTAPFITGVFETISLRFVGATLLHTLSSGIIGYYWALGMVKGKTTKYLAIGFPIATLLHATFNYLILMYGSNTYSVVFLLLVGFFVLNDFERIKINKVNLIV